MPKKSKEIIRICLPKVGHNFSFCQDVQHDSSYEGVGLNLAVVLCEIFIIGGVAFQIAVEVPVQHLSDCSTAGNSGGTMYQ